MIFYLSDGVKFLRHRMVWIAVGVCLAILASLSAITLMGLSGWFITASALAGSAVPAMAVGFNFLQPAAQIRALAITRTVARYAERVINHDVTLRLLADLRSRFFKQVIPIAPACFGDYRSADLLTRITRDIDALDALYLEVFVPSAVAAVSVLATGIFLWTYAPMIAYTTLSLLVIPGLILPWIAYRKTLKNAQILAQRMAHLKSLLIDNARGLAELKVYQADERYHQFIATVSGACIAVEQRMNRFAAICSMLSGLIRNLGLLAALAMGVWMLNLSVLEGPHLAMLLFCVLLVFESVAPMASAYQSLAKANASAQRIRGVLDSSQRVATAYQASPESVSDGYGIQIEDVSFCYPGSTKSVLTGVNLNVPEGRRVAIIGESGAGKSSLLNLLLKFYTPTKGVIKIGGANIAGIVENQIIAKIGLMTQDSQLFDATIRENLMIGDPQATQEQLDSVIRMVQLSEFIQSLAAGLDTWVGEEGDRVSGGEARRVALARVFLKNAPILLLDEPTEGLDVETERLVWSALDTHMVEKTVVLVTHRDSGIALMDEVFTLNEGRITHKSSETDYLALQNL